VILDHHINCSWAGRISDFKTEEEAASVVAAVRRSGQHRRRRSSRVANPSAEIGVNPPVVETPSTPPPELQLDQPSEVPIVAEAPATPHRVRVLYCVPTSPISPAEVLPPESPSNVEAEVLPYEELAALLNDIDAVLDSPPAIMEVDESLELSADVVDSTDF
jgi:hypothetical protein